MRIVNMNFKEWCAIDPEDNRKIVYENLGFTSDDYVTPAQMFWLSTKAVIERLKLVGDEWHVWLK